MVRSTLANRIAFVGTLGGLAGSAALAVEGLSPLAIEINVTNTSGASRDWGVFVSAGDFEADDMQFSWQLANPIAMRDPVTQELVATLLDATFDVNGGTDIALNCTIQAAARDATITIRSSQIELGEPMDSSGQYARATAAISVTDVDGNGAFVRGVGTPGTGAFRARFNDGAQNFTTLVAFVFAGGGSTASGFQNDPAFGFRPVAGPLVQSMENYLSFTLTKNDLASATTTFEFQGPQHFQLFADGDMNCDAVTNPADISGFVLALVNSDAYDATFDNCALSFADVDNDGEISVTDISAFVSVLAADSTN